MVMTIHGGVRLAGVDPEIENFELEELSVDPVAPGIGRMWVNTVEHVVKYVSGKNPDDSLIVRVVATKADVDAVLADVVTAAQLAAVNDALALKADTAAVNAALAEKADVLAMALALDTKADEAETIQALASKADATQTTEALATKASLSVTDALATAIASKADSDAVTQALALKTDSSVTTALTAVVASKADAAATTDALASKADSAATTQALALKADKATTVAGYGITDAALASDTADLHQTFVDGGGLNGFVDRNDIVLTFNNATRTLTITPSNGVSYRFYNKGVRYTKNGVLTVQIPDQMGNWFVYFDGTGQLQISPSSWNIMVLTPICIVHWNTDLQAMVMLCDERHMSIMDPATHAYLHTTEGTKYKSGLVAGNYILNGDGSLDTHVQLSISNGAIQDEDLAININHAAVPSGDFQQYLTTAAKLPPMYRLNQGWRKDVASSFPLKSGVSRPVINTLNGGTGQWELTEVTDGNYFAMFAVATNALTEPIVAMMGQLQDTTLDAAKVNNDFATLNWGTMPFPEFKALYRLIFQTSSAYGNSKKARLVAIDDLRNVKTITVSAITSTAHNSLTGLTNDDHTQYMHNNTARSVTAQHMFAPLANQAPFLLGAKAQGQLVPGLNADMLDGLTSGDFQPISSNLSALASVATSGLYVRNGATAVTRVLTGTANQITITNGDGVAGNPTASLANNPVLPGTAGVTLPSGTTAQRVDGLGKLRYNTTLDAFEGFGNNGWFSLSSKLAQYFSGTVAQASGNAIIPYGNTAPTSSQGTQVWSQVVTPSLASSTVEIEFSGFVDLSSPGAYITMSIFRGTTLVGLVTISSAKQGTDFPATFILRAIDKPNSVTAQTYSCRIGVSAGTWYLGRGQSATYGGTNPSPWTIKEFV